jgi:hypothetical protein
MTEKPYQLFNAFKILFVKNKEESSNYYLNTLGFKDEGHGCYEREGIWIILHENKNESAIRPNHLVDGWSADLYVAVKGVDHFYEEFISRKALVVKEPTIEMTGMKEFMVEDLDGYWIVFAEYVGINQ